MNTILDNEMIIKAYDHMIDTKVEYETLAMRHFGIDTSLKATIATAIVMGKVVGKNETERSAVAMEMYADQYKEVDESEVSMLVAKLYYDCAVIEVEKIRALLRLAEITSRNMGE